MIQWVGNVSDIEFEMAICGCNVRHGRGIEWQWKPVVELELDAPFCSSFDLVPVLP